MMINSAGIGFSNTGINGTFTSAWTTDGTLNMQNINVINLVADMMKGGTLKLGGENNVNGTLEIYDKDGNKVGRIDNTGFSLSISGEIENLYDALNNKVLDLEGTLNNMEFDFSTRGLAIGTASDPNNSLLDNSGIKVYNYDKLNAIFNNRGSGIDKLIVTGTAQLGYLKFVKSTKNNQPVTKIFHLKELIEDLEDLEV